MLRYTVLAVAIAFFCTLPGYAVQTEPSASPLDWITGSGDSLELHTRVVLVDGSGNRISNAEVKCEMETQFAIIPLPVNTGAEGEFHVTIPCNYPWLWTIRVSAKTPDGSCIGYKSLEGRELRCVARDGLSLTMHKLDGPNARVVEIKVVDEDGPVPGASVKALVQQGREVIVEADMQGIASLRLLDSEKLLQITAWKEDDRIGGYQMDRRPVRNPSLNSYTIELIRARPLTVRLLDEQGQPVPNIRLQLNVSTGAPDFNFIGHGEYTTLTTNEAGEAIAKWFPDWDDVNFHLNLKTDEWKLRDESRGEPGREVMEYVLKKSRKHERKSVQGRIELPGGSPAGFLVFFWSRQGESKKRADVLTSHADPEGNFVVHVLPGANYLYYIDDPEWISEAGQQVLFDPETGDHANPVLHAVKGHELRVLVTQGPDKIPLPGQTVYLRSMHNHPWIIDGRARVGGLGRQWSVTTDANGMATTYATAGPVTASSFSLDWQAEEQSGVAEGEINEIRLHRPFAEAIQLTGLLKSSGNAVLENATVFVSALDDNSPGQSTVQTDASGKFAAEVKATRVGVCALTADGRHSATTIIELPLNGPIEMALEPTVDYAGQLLGDDDKPLANAVVFARAEWMQDSGAGDPSPDMRAGNISEATTGEDGRYVLNGVPAGMRFVLEFQPAASSLAPQGMGDRFITTGENRPLDVHRAVPLAAVPLSFADSTARNLEDCRNYGIYSLVFLLSDQSSTEWANSIVSDYDENRAILGYLPRFIKADKLNEQEDKKEFFAKYDLQQPAPNHLTVCVLTGAGDLIARLDLDCSNPESEKTVHEFIKSHEPAAGDARKSLDAALADAARTGRVVWVQHSQTRCGPCFLLSRWIEEHREVLEKQFVFVKVDDARQANGGEVVKLVTRDRRFGIPFVAIMNPEGEILIDGEGPLGNISFPTTFEGAQHLRKMISLTGDQISAPELDVLLDSLLQERR